MNAYSVLGVTETASRAEIRTAYRARARELHPDLHRRPDGTVPAQAETAWLELTEALHTALAAAAAVPALPSGLMPRQRGAAAAPPRQVAPRQVAPRQVAPRQVAPRRPTVEPSVPRVPRDPMLLLLTLPRECRDEWAAEELEVWALTLVPAARKHLTRARRLVDQLGLVNERHRAAATTHVLLTLTLTLHPARRLRVLAHRLPAAYAVLERQLPLVVVDQLPPRASAWRPRTGGLSLPWRR